MIVQIYYHNVDSSILTPTTLTQVVTSAIRRDVACRMVVQHLGDERIRKLHRQFVWVDLAAVICVPAALLLNGLQLVAIPLSITFVVRLILQSILLLWIAYLMHELTHRQWAGERCSRALAWIFGTPLFYIAGRYAETHSLHHRWLGGPSDLAFPRFFDKRWKRLLLLTPVGFVLGLIASATDVDHASKKHIARTERLQRGLFVGAWAIIIFLAINGVPLVSFGFFLPLFVVIPVLNAVRLVLEHAEIDSDLGVHCATYYRTGLITQVIFMAGVGDCHLVHHLFPSIPFYQLPKAVTELRPVLTELGALERRSLCRILIAYFVRCQPYGSLWEG